MNVIQCDADFATLTIVGGPFGGTPANRLRLGLLRRELERMRIPGIEDQTLGKAALLAAFDEAIRRVAAQVAERECRTTRKRLTALDAVIAEQAAALIASGHGGQDSLESVAPPAPQRPIASTSMKGLLNGQ